MAELRPLTARDIKGNVEGYQEMSDEAFARRFYSDRAELVGLGVPLDSQRDEHTGEELYTLRSERYFLPPLELDDDELAALQTCLYLLEGRFAYAEPLRLALQNLALGRASDTRERAPTPPAVRDAARARLPDPGGVRRRRLPWPRRVAVRRAAGRSPDRSRSRYRLVGQACLRITSKSRRRRHLRHRVRTAAAPRPLGAPPGRAR